MLVRICAHVGHAGRLLTALSGPRRGTGGLNAANQIYNRFKAAGKALNEGDIAILDAAQDHYYQVRYDISVHLKIGAN